VEVDHTERTIALAAVGSTSCIVEHCGHLRCFGMNANGVRGEEFLKDRVVPGPNVLERVHDVSLGGWSSTAHGLAIRHESRLYAWGSNGAGELGDGTYDGRWEPVEIEFSDEPAQVAAGHRFSCLLTVAGQPYCWGSNSRGQLGHDAAGLTPTALSTGDLPAFEEIAAGIDHACVRAGDDVWCWGSNDNGRRGNGSAVPGTSLVAVPLQAEPAE
jgi:alpha-tubulin suppressor-like RCC1 family protein